MAWSSVMCNMRLDTPQGGAQLDMWTPIIVAAGVAIFLGVVGGLMTPIGVWYRQLRKPPWQPPDWAFGPAWTIILGLAAWSAVVAWNAASTDAAPAHRHHALRDQRGVPFPVEPALLPPAPARLGADRGRVPVGFAARACSIRLRPISVKASLLIVPYLLWVSFAACLNPRSCDATAVRPPARFWLTCRMGVWSRR